MSSEASLFREPHHFSMNNKDIHRFTDHQFTISFSHNSVLSVILRTSPFSDVCIPIFAISAMLCMFVLNINNISSPSVIRGCHLLYYFLPRKSIPPENICLISYNDNGCLLLSVLAFVLLYFFIGFFFIFRPKMNDAFHIILCCLSMSQGDFVCHLK